MEQSELIMLIVSALAPFVTAVLAAVGASSTRKALITAAICLLISLVANWQAGTLDLVPIITAYVAAIGSAQTLWLVQKPVDLLGKLNRTVAPDGII